jgi:hypothetical protein
VSVREAITSLGECEGVSCLEKTFSWVIEGKLGGSSCPGNYPSSLQLDLKIFKEMGITCIVSLNEASLDTTQVNQMGIRHVVMSVEVY